jgi:hypothetical protein
MKRFVFITAWFSSLILVGCITDYEARGVDEEKDILVVEGLITEGESYITLSRSIYLNDVATFNYIYDATVYVECEDGTRMEAENPSLDPYWGFSTNRYAIQIDQLHLDRKYRLKIEINEPDTQSRYAYDEVAYKTFEYASDYSNPIATPEIDSVFWTKREKGHPISIHVATHDPDNRALYFRWSYREDWQIISDVSSMPPYYYPYFCWNFENSHELLLGSGNKTIFGNVTEILTQMPPYSRKLEALYRIDVKQNAISKRAHDYFANIKKNAQHSGSLFTPAPSELRGNIVCITDPNRPVIGYVDVSLTTQKRRYITRAEDVYEYARRTYDCEPVLEDSLRARFDESGGIPIYYVPYNEITGPFGIQLFYIINSCVDCTLFGTTQKPEDWPN